MSRIVGLVTSNEPSRASQLIGAGLLGLQPLPTWRNGHEAVGAASLGWSGRRAPAVARASNCIAAVDGHIFNIDAFGLTPEAHAGNPAAALIDLYRRHGFEEALKRIDGELAAALYDGDADCLWLGRDRLGLRPLYYVDRPGLFAFASRPSALLGLPDVPRAVNRRFAAVFAGSHYRSIDNRPEESPYEAIRQLPAGHILRYAGRTARTAAYWTLTEEPEFTAGEDELGEQMRALLLDAVRRRLHVCKNPAFTLSGGLDSSSVLSCAVELTGVGQHAYSSTYADPTYDETAEIQPMLTEKVAQWHPVAIGNQPDLLDQVRAMVQAHDEPVATATWLSHHQLMGQVAADGFDAVFGGLGGDELNAGEYEYFIFHFADLRAAGDEAALSHEIACWAQHHDHPIFRKDATVAEAAMARMTDGSARGRCRPDQNRLHRYVETVNREWYDLPGFEPVMDHPFTHHLKNRTYQDIFRETAPCCLRAEDRHAAAFGLERFDPFFDHHLVEFMFRVPGRFKIRDGITKRLLRAAMQGILPEETRTRIKKTGWNAPAHVWFSGSGADMLRDLIASRAFREQDLYDVAAVERLLDEHLEIVSSGQPRENHMMFFWQLLNVTTWLETAG